MGADYRIRTFTGRWIDPLEMNMADLHVKDIAHALSMICRFGGHCRHFYSVAEHSVLVSRRCPPRLRLEGLLHDVAEAYIGDVPLPLKEQLPALLEAEHKLLSL